MITLTLSMIIINRRVQDVYKEFNNNIVSESIYIPREVELPSQLLNDSRLDKAEHIDERWMLKNELET